MCVHETYKANALDLSRSPLIIQIIGHFRHIQCMLQNLAFFFFFFNDPFGVVAVFQKSCDACSKLWETMVLFSQLELGLD